MRPAEKLLGVEGFFTQIALDRLAPKFGDAFLEYKRAFGPGLPSTGPALSRALKDLDCFAEMHSDVIERLYQLALKTIREFHSE